MIRRFEPGPRVEVTAGHEGQSLDVVQTQGLFEQAPCSRPVLTFVLASPRRRHLPQQRLGFDLETALGGAMLLFGKEENVFVAFEHRLQQSRAFSKILFSQQMLCTVKSLDELSCARAVRRVCIGKRDTRASRSAGSDHLALCRAPNPECRQHACGQPHVCQAIPAHGSYLSGCRYRARAMVPRPFKTYPLRIVGFEAFVSTDPVAKLELPGTAFELEHSVIQQLLRLFFQCGTQL